jgi:CRISPR/Cas system-associated exonuclease Cas4 (RecB family)
MSPWILAVLALAIGLALILRGRGMRRRRGLGQGRTLDLDSRNPYSRRFGLSGRPDRIIEGGVPEEWKSARRVYDSHRAQMGVYFILLEEETGIWPPHGFIVTGDGTRQRIENTDEFRAWVLGVADQIQAARRQMAEIIQVNPPPAKCRSCGQRGNCGQARG